MILQVSLCCDFGGLVSTLPKLLVLSLVNVYGLVFTTENIHLPECHFLSFYLVDAMDRRMLRIQAPQLKTLNLKCCSAGTCDCELRLMPSKGPPVVVDVTATGVDGRTVQHLMQHPRLVVARIKGMLRFSNLMLNCDDSDYSEKKDSSEWDTITNVDCSDGDDYDTDECSDDDDDSDAEV